uniref:U3 small nucleolar RNA-associated protein 25 homolog n=1 Tax=Anopheles atroparvus TaxID=41427 RepID=A0AAG5DPC0_ANOAO
MKKKIKKEQADRPPPSRFKKNLKHLERGQEAVEAQKRQIEAERKYRSAATRREEFASSDSDGEEETENIGTLEDLAETFNQGGNKVISDDSESEEESSDLEEENSEDDVTDDENSYESLAADPPLVERKVMPFGTLGNVHVELPKCGKTMTETKSILQKETYAKPGEYPTLPVEESIDWSALHVKEKIARNIPAEIDPMQREMFAIMNNYQDLFYARRNLENAEKLRFVYCLHALNHVIKAVTKIQHHNLKLAASSQSASKKWKGKKKKTTEVAPAPTVEYRDQGFVRPKVLIIVPFRESALQIVNLLKQLFAGDDPKAVTNYKRFAEEYGGGDTLQFPQINRKPEDYEQTFAGNIDDNFRIGIAFNRSSMKLYTRYYSSDLILASPLGLRMTIGAKGEEHRDYDFLSSIELLIIDQAEICLAQNWDHVLHVMEHLHHQPQSAEHTEFSRVREWFLNGWSKFYRQTILLSAMELPEFRWLFNKQFKNYRGKIRSINLVPTGSIKHVVVKVPQSFQRIETTTLESQSNARFAHFVNVILPQARSVTMARCLIYVPSYFDFVRLRNYFKKEEISFTQICEYTTDAKIARARDMFYHGSKHFLLYSERSHFYRRHRIKGMRHLVMYGPPVFPHFYPEMVNLMANEYQNGKDGVDPSTMTVTVLYTMFDSYYLSEILGTQRASSIIQAPRSVYRFTTDHK